MTPPDGYVLLGHGPSAMGSSSGWRMREDFVAECPRCGDMISLAPDETVTCTCGACSRTGMQVDSAAPSVTPVSPSTGDPEELIRRSVIGMSARIAATC